MAADDVLHARPDRRQELVAGHVPEAVVDALETVHIDEDQRVRLAVQGRPPQCLIQPLHQHAAVRQAGEAVVEGVMVQFVLEGLALGDVPEGDHRAGRHAVAHHGGSRIGDRDGAAVLAAEPRVVLPDGPAGAHGLAGRDEQEVGRGRARRRSPGRRSVMSSDGSSIMSAAARLTNVSLPSASMAQTPSPMLRVIEESRSRSRWTCWYSSALLSAPLPTAASARSRPRSASSNGSSRRRPDATSHCCLSATVIGAASWPRPGSAEVSAASGLRSSRRTAPRIVSSTACCRSPGSPPA